MGKLIARILVLVLLYLLGYAGLRFFGILEAKSVLSASNPGESVTQIHVAEDKPAFVGLIYKPLCELEGVAYGVHDISKNKKSQPSLDGGTSSP